MSFIADNHKLSSQRQCLSVADLTVNAGEHDPRVVICDDVSIAVLWFVDLQVGILPCELLAGVNRLIETEETIKNINEITLLFYIVYLIKHFFQRKMN